MNIDIQAEDDKQTWEAMNKPGIVRIQTAILVANWMNNLAKMAGNNYNNFDDRFKHWTDVINLEVLEGLNDKGKLKDLPAYQKKKLSKLRKIEINTI